MAIPKWSEKDLMWAKDEGFKIIKCSSEEEVEEIKHTLKMNKRCVRSGRIVNKENQDVFFVLTKERK